MESMHFPQGGWHVKISLGIPQGDPSIKETKKRTHQQEAFPNKALKSDGGCTAKMHPRTANTTPNTHQDTSSNAFFEGIEAEKCACNSQGGFLSNVGGLVGQPTPMCEILGNSKEIKGNQ